MKKAYIMFLMWIIVPFAAIGAELIIKDAGFFVIIFGFIGAIIGTLMLWDYPEEK